MRQDNSPIWRLVFIRYNEQPGVIGGHAQCIDIARPSKKEKELMLRIAEAD